MTQIVAVDIGGTHARFALAELGDGRVSELMPPVTLQVGDHESLESAWSEFRRQQGGALPDGAAIAVASPVGGEEIRLTNNPWVIRPATLAGSLGVSHFELLNDFAAVGHAVAQVGPEHLLHLCGPDVPLPRKGTISVIGPGTGLGVAHILSREEHYHIQATEGGHMGFAPVDPFEDALLERLRERHGRVSVERIVAGPGIVHLYDALAERDGWTGERPDDRTLWAQGTSGENSRAAEAVERFCLSLGSVAGDIALAQGACGVVIAGGLGLRIQDAIRKSGFSERFSAKGRFAAMLREMPVKLITHSQPGLYGAAAAFARRYRD